MDNREFREIPLALLNEMTETDQGLIEDRNETAIIPDQDIGDVNPLMAQTEIKQEPVENEDAMSIHTQHELPNIQCGICVPNISVQREETTVHPSFLSPTGNVSQLQTTNSDAAAMTPGTSDGAGGKDVQGHDETHSESSMIDVSIPPYPVTLYHRWTTSEGNMVVGENVNVDARNVNNRQEAENVSPMSSVINIVQPIETRAQDKPFMCAMCDYRSAKKNDLVRHIKTHPGGKTFTCSVCGYRCSTERHLVKHMNAHGGKPYTCSVCEFRSAKKPELDRHNKTHTVQKTYTCSSCDYVCNKERSLAKHTCLGAHTDEKPYNCSVCDYRCNLKNSLVKHMRTHTGERPYRCSVCNFSFTQGSSLSTHMSTHTGEKPHQCSFCEYRCSRKADIVIHTRSHTGEKPFVCAMCDYRCTSNTRLVSHMASHTEEKPHLCSVCGNSFAARKYLLRHMKLHDQKP